jgi:hypothetical protein
MIRNYLSRPQCVRLRASLWIAAILAVLLPTFAHADPQGPACGRQTDSALPNRPPDAPKGTDFVRQVSVMNDDDREAAIQNQLLIGNIPEFLRRLVPVRLDWQIPGEKLVRLTFCVLPDYLAIGSDKDFLLVPMRLATALTVAARYGFTLPTAKMVDAIYEQSAVHLAPQPLPAGDQMRSTGYYQHHNELVGEQRAAVGGLLGLLTAGDKKDLVITNRLWSNLERVAIYGWHKLDHNPIQPLSTVHGARYADYSHGVRLVSETVYVDGAPRPIFDVLSDPKLSRALNSEGPIARLTELIATLTAIRLPPHAVSLQTTSH